MSEFNQTRTNGLSSNTVDVESNVGVGVVGLIILGFLARLSWLYDTVNRVGHEKVVEVQIISIEIQGVRIAIMMIACTTTSRMHCWLCFYGFEPRLTQCQFLKALYSV